MPRPPAPKAIALWRYERIEEALAAPSGDVRGEIVRTLAQTPVLWPCGRTGRISVATLYRWINVYLHKGLDALRPARRRDAGKLRASVPDEVVSKARALFTNDPDISFTFVLELLKADPTLQLQQRSIVPSRSTLQRRLAADPAYAQLKRARKLARRRGRFIGRHVHDIWHLDAKGPVKVRLTNGEHLHIHVLTVLDNVSREPEVRQ
jgi:hypothetical protein